MKCELCGDEHAMGITDREWNVIEYVTKCKYCIFRLCSFGGEFLFKDEEHEKKIGEYQRDKASP